MSCWLSMVLGLRVRSEWHSIKDHAKVGVLFLWGGGEAVQGSSK